MLAPEVQQQVASIGYVDNGEHFITLLSQADKVTIVGLTNESLASMLRTALDRKREAIFRPDECWSSVRVVFLTEELLDWVNDERGFVDPGQARLQRQRLGVFGRRTVRVFLKSLPTRSRWDMYDSPHLPPLIGTLFEMPDGRRIVQLLIRRQVGNAGDHLYLEFEDTRGQYFSTAFDEIVHSSVDDNKVAPVGAVNGQRFRVRETRYRWSVLIEGSGAKDWLAMVLVVTWRVRNGQAEPLLQLRTRLNATRELDRLTHLAGHIMHDDPVVRGMEFGFDDAIPLAAARKRVQMETGEVDSRRPGAADHRRVHPPGQGAPVLLRVQLSAARRAGALAAGRDVSGFGARATGHPEEPGPAERAVPLREAPGEPPGPDKCLRNRRAQPDPPRP